jgi:Putative zinc finger motif, C2HC5-type
MGATHPLLAAAPNCLSCGKIVCAREGLAPCTFCGGALLTSTQMADMARALREERGRERMAANNRTSNNNSNGQGQAPGTGVVGRAQTEALEKAQAHRDRLLGFQSSNAARTRVVDEAAAFETPEAGTTRWGSATDRAAQLKRQQRVLREMEWAARPEYEKRRVVVSVDLVKGKVVKRMGPVERDEEASGRNDSDDSNLDEVTASRV